MADVAAGPDRPATGPVAKDLARSAPACGRARLGQAGFGQGLRPFPNRTIPNRTIRAIVGIALGHRLVGAALLAFIVVVEHRALGAGDPCAAITIGLEAVLADQRTDPRRF